MFLLVNPLLTIATTLLLLSIAIFAFYKIKGENTKIPKTNISLNKRMIYITCSILLVISLALGIKGIFFNEKHDENSENYYNENVEKYDVEINIEFVGNLLFNRYDVEVELYDQKEVLYHGVDKTLNFKLPNGKHKLKFESTEDATSETVELKVDGKTKVTYQISCHTDEIKVKELSVEYEKSKEPDIQDEKDEPTDTGSSKPIIMIVLAEEYIGKNYKDIEKEMKDLGYKNVLVEAKETTDTNNKNDTIAEFTIAGKTYERGTEFKETDEVKITYWSLKENKLAKIVFPQTKSKLAKDIDKDSLSSENTRIYINVNGSKNIPEIKKYENATVTDGVYDYLEYLKTLGFKIEVTKVNDKEPYSGFYLYESSYKVSNDHISWTMDLSIQEEAYVEYEFDINLK